MCFDVHYPRGHDVYGFRLLRPEHRRGKASAGQTGHVHQYGGLFRHRDLYVPGKFPVWHPAVRFLLHRSRRLCRSGKLSPLLCSGLHHHRLQFQHDGLPKRPGKDRLCRLAGNFEHILCLHPGFLFHEQNSRGQPIPGRLCHTTCYCICHRHHDPLFKNAQRIQQPFCGKRAHTPVYFCWRSGFSAYWAKVFIPLGL